MKDETEVLLEMYKIQIDRSEHYESQRATITNLVITLAAAIVALTTFDGALTQADLWNGIIIVILGVFGYIASKLHGTRSRRHGKRAAEYRNVIDQMLPDANINAIRKRVPREKTYLYRVWHGLHIAVILIGALIIIFSVIRI